MRRLWSSLRISTNFRLRRAAFARAGSTASETRAEIAMTSSTSSREFWLTIPRARRAPDPTKPNRECVYYAVACVVQGARDGADAPTNANANVTVTAERTTRRRYREFIALKEDLDAECGRGCAPEAPPRKRFGRVNADEQRVEERRRALESWLWSVLANEQCARSEALRRFARVGAAERALRRALAGDDGDGVSVDVDGLATPTRTRESPSVNGVGEQWTPEVEMPTPESATPSPLKARATEIEGNDARIDQVAIKSTTEIVHELEKARAEVQSLSEELATTKECLKDARAAATAAQDKLNEVEATSLKGRKVLSKEIRSLRRQLEEASLDKNEQTNIISAEERAASLREVMREVSALRARVQECTYEKLLSVETNGPHGHSGGDPNELLAVSDNRLAVLLAETQIMIPGGEDSQHASQTDSPESAEMEEVLINTEGEVRQTFADLLSDLINARKSINSLLRKVARKSDTVSLSTDSRAIAANISSRVGNLVGALGR